MSKLTIAFFLFYALGYTRLVAADPVKTAPAQSHSPEDHDVRVIHREITEMRKGGYLGVQLIEMTPELRQHFAAAKTYGVLISKVENDSPAQKAGLKVGDVLVSVNGKNVADTSDVVAVVRAMAANSPAKLRLVRNRKSKMVTATIEVKEIPAVNVFRLWKSKDGEFKGPFEFGDPLLDHVEVYKDVFEKYGDIDAVKKGKLKKLESRIEELEKRLEKLSKDPVPKRRKPSAKPGAQY